MKKFVKSILLLPLLMAGVSCYDTENNDNDTNTEKTNNNCPTCQQDSVVNHTINVENKDVKILVDDTGTTKQIRASVTPTSDTITYSSTDTSVATVSNTGVVTGVKANSSCEIIVKSSGGAEKRVPVTTYDLSTYYTYQSSNHDVINGCVDDAPVELTLPSTFPDSSTQMKTIGKTNDSEGKNFLWGLKSLKKITIPEGYTIIRVTTFVGLTNLETLILPSTLTSISQGAFYNCPNIKNIYFSKVTTNEDGTTTTSYEETSNSTFAVSPVDDLENGSRVLYGISNHVAYLGFNNPNGALFSDSLGITALGKYSYFNYDSLTKVNIPSTVADLPGYAMSGNNITSVNILAATGTSLYVHDKFIQFCPKLESIELANEGIAYSGRTFYSKDNEGTKTNSIFISTKSATYMPIGTKATNVDTTKKLPNNKVLSAITISGEPFLGMGVEGNLVLPQGCRTTTDLNLMFGFNENMTGVYIPNSLTSLPSLSFTGYYFPKVDPDTGCPYDTYKLFNGRKTVSQFYGCNENFTIYYQTRTDGKTFAEAFPDAYALLNDECNLTIKEVADSTLAEPSSSSEGE